MSAPTIADPEVGQLRQINSQLLAALACLLDTAPLDVAEEIDPVIVLHSYRQFVRRTASVAMIKAEGAA